MAVRRKMEIGIKEAGEVVSDEGQQRQPVRMREIVERAREYVKGINTNKDNNKKIWSSH